MEEQVNISYKLSTYNALTDSFDFKDLTEKLKGLNNKPRKKVYISGQISGLEENEWKSLFNNEANRLKNEGYDVINPADHPDQTSWEAYMKYDIKLLVDCDMVVVLDNWKSSRGAKEEVRIAQTLKIPVYDKKWNKIQTEEERNPAEVASDLVYGDRCNSYGHPKHDFARTAKMWSGLFGDKLKEDFKPEEVALAMVCVKMSRERNAPKNDNIVDGIGYFICYDRVVNDR